MQVEAIQAASSQPVKLTEGPVKGISGQFVHATASTLPSSGHILLQSLSNPSTFSRISLKIAHPRQPSKQNQQLSKLYQQSSKDQRYCHQSLARVNLRQ